MPYPEVIQVVCPNCKADILVHKENEGKEHVCIKCGLWLIPEQIDIPDPRHIC